LWAAGHHSCARIEAGIRGLGAGFAEEFPRPPVDYEDALCFCDMTNGPDGDPVPAAERLTEIQVRYGVGHPVTDFVDAAPNEILASVASNDQNLWMALGGVT
jgi:hypothetical protein